MTLDRKKILSFLILFAVTSLFCMGLYRWNNKYTYGSLQPDHGQLTITDEDLSDFHFLINDWEFYPDVLLTPETLNADRSGLYMVYTDIGERTRFDSLGTSDDPYGCGTYVLHLWLPEGTRTYSLELPEIFSAYELYINGEHYLQIGDPDPDHYSARTQSRIITFRADGYADIMISVSNYSHFYSGIIYPPIFGLPGKLTQLQNFRNCFIMLILAFGLLLALVSGYLAVVLKKKNALLYMLLSLVMCSSICYPLLHSLVELPVFPWYTLEIASIYLIPCIGLLLHNSICEVGRWTRRISVTAAFLFFAAACSYSIAAPELTVNVMRLFSRLLFVYKLGLAVYILVTSFLAVEYDKEEARPLYYAGIAYAFFFLWDRILPAYEPILFGWFSDWGNLVLVFAIGYYLIHNMSVSYLHNLTFSEEKRQLTRQLTMQREYSRQLSEQSEQNRRLMHDFRQHMRTLSVLTERIQPSPEIYDTREELLAYVKELSQNSFAAPAGTLEHFSPNPSVDALLQYYYTSAKQQHIEMDLRLVPVVSALSDVELCTVLGNLLENAVDACLKLPGTADKMIRMQSHETDGQLFIRIDNTYDGKVWKSNQRYLSRKTDGFRYGVGIESVQAIVESHGGSLDIYPMDSIFRIGITLPLS